MSDLYVLFDVVLVIDVNVFLCCMFFIEFVCMGLLGFGGVLFFVCVGIVDCNCWFFNIEFVELLSFGQVLFGLNVVNLLVMLGYWYYGVCGVVVVMGGFVFMFVVLLLLIVMLYD